MSLSVAAKRAPNGPFLVLTSNISSSHSLNPPLHLWWSGFYAQLLYVLAV